MFVSFIIDILVFLWNEDENTYYLRIVLYILKTNNYLQSLVSVSFD